LSNLSFFNDNARIITNQMPVVKNIFQIKICLSDKLTTFL